jgi:ribonuclease J
MLKQHAQLAAREGLIEADRVLVVEDGDCLGFSSAGARRGERIQAGRILLDRSGSSEVEDVVVRDRRHLSADGIVVPVIVLDKQTGLAAQAPEIVTRGFVDEEERAELIEEAGRVVVRAVEERTGEEGYDPALTRERVRGELRRLFKRRMQRRPMVIPVVMEV